MITLAKMLCIIAHWGQKRKYTGEPYHNHPFEVYRLVKSVGANKETQIAALLHDVVEDTLVPLHWITTIFGAEVGVMVYRLTDVSKPSDGKRARRKKIDRVHVGCGSANVHTVKLADLISNSGTIVQRDHKFAKIYMEEKRLLVNVLYRGHPELLKRANEILDSYFNPQQRK